MKYSSETKRKLLEEIAEIYFVPDQEENEVTVREFAEAATMNLKQAATVLGELVNAGKYTKRRVRSAEFNRPCMAYRKVEDE